MKGKKIVSTLLVLLLLASLPVSALAAEWDIGKGDITVNAGSGGQTVTQGSQVDVPDSAPVITGSSTENTLTINAEKDQTANVTLSDVNIDVSSEGKAAVSTNGEGNVSIEPGTSDLLTTGWIEYYAPGADMEKDKPEKTTVGTLPPQEKPIERGADALFYRVTTKDGKDIDYTAEQKGSVLTVTVDEDLAILTGRLSGIRTLKAQGVEKIVFVTKGAASAFLLSDLLGKGESGEAYRLTHDGKAVTFTLGKKMTDVSAILTKP